MAKALFTENQIIQTGEEITKERGEIATGWQIHQRLGGRGKLDRYEKVWEEHCQSRSAPPPVIDVAIPEATQTRIDTSVNTLGASVSAIVSDVIRDQLDQARRQISLAQQAHDQQLRDVVEERDYLKAHVAGVEDALEQSEKKISALEKKLERAGSSKSTVAKAPKAAAKSPRQSPQRTSPKLTPAPKGDMPSSPQ